MKSLCILIPLLVGLISALLGYLLGKLGSKGNTILHDDYDALKLELDNCRKKSAQLSAELAACKASVSAGSGTFVAPALIPFDAGLAQSVFGKKVVADDLKIVEGIGPKIEELFHNAGIKTWKALGETPIAKCQEILDNAGDRYTMHKPGTWPKQAQMAYEGKWQELKIWQDELDGGK